MMFRLVVALALVSCSTANVTPSATTVSKTIQDVVSTAQHIYYDDYDSTVIDQPCPVGALQLLAKQSGTLAVPPWTFPVPAVYQPNNFFAHQHIYLSRDCNVQNGDVLDVTLTTHTGSMQLFVKSGGIEVDSPDASTATITVTDESNGYSGMGDITFS